MEEKKFDSLKEKLNEKKEEISKKVSLKKDVKTEKALVTSRILFVSVLDKIYLVTLVCYLVFALTMLNFGVGAFFVGLISLVVLYFILNWFYKCSIKTMLCLTNKRVYMEYYAPFFYRETSIPVNRITKVDTIDVFWIFRVIIIHQYNHLPLVFPTWNNHQFKDKLDEMITTENTKVENEFKSRNILSKSSLKWLKWVGIVVAVIAVISIFVGLIKSLNNPEKKVAGSYTAGDYSISFDYDSNSDNQCDIDSLTDYLDRDKIVGCTWYLDEEYNEVVVEYEYEYKLFYSTYTSERTVRFDWDKSEKTLTIDEDDTLVFEKN